MKLTGKDVAKAAITMAMSSSIEEEKILKENYREDEILTCAVNIGGNVINSIPKILESTLVAAKRNNLVGEKHVYDGAILGATREALGVIVEKASGFNAGGKVGVARYQEHIVVCIFLSIGLLHLDEVVIGLGHRVIPTN